METEYYYGKNAIMCYDFNSSDGKSVTIINVYNKKNYAKKGEYTLINDLKDDVDIKNVIGRKDNHIILAGDFNTFAKKDNERLKELEENMKLFGLSNCIEDQSLRMEPTYFDANYGYGIDDFCFISESVKNNSKININIPKKD